MNALTPAFLRPGEGRETAVHDWLGRLGEGGGT